MDALWEVLDRVILDNGRHINKHMRDGIITTWEAQAAQESDPEQAVRAGLEIQAAGACRAVTQGDRVLRIVEAATNAASINCSNKKKPLGRVLAMQRYH